jgi:hypothetical protein
MRRLLFKDYHAKALVSVKRKGGSDSDSNIDFCNNYKIGIVFNGGKSKSGLCKMLEIYFERLH